MVPGPKGGLKEEGPGGEEERKKVNIKSSIIMTILWFIGLGSPLVTMAHSIRSGEAMASLKRTLQWSL